MLRANKKHCSGFILLELLLAVSIAAGAAAWMGTRTDAWQTASYKSELRLAAELLAEDLRRLQQESMFYYVGNYAYLRQMSTSPQTYNIYNYYNLRTEFRTVSFKKQGLGNVYFANPLSVTVAQFTEKGAPSYTCNFILKHYQLSSYQYRISVQPVSGRVVINEEK